jgi:hypothetical protein
MNLCSKSRQTTRPSRKLESDAAKDADGSDYRRLREPAKRRGGRGALQSSVMFPPEHCAECSDWNMLSMQSCLYMVVCTIPPKCEDLQGLSRVGSQALPNRRARYSTPADCRVGKSAWDGLPFPALGALRYVGQNSLVEHQWSFRKPTSPDWNSGFPEADFWSGITSGLPVNRPESETNQRNVMGRNCLLFLQGLSIQD